MHEGYISQYEFSRKHGIPTMQMAKVRREYVEDHEWKKDGAVILWKNEAAERVSKILREKKPKKRGRRPKQPVEIEQVEEIIAPLPDEPEIQIDEPEHIEPEITHSEITVRVTREAKNKRYVYAALDGEQIPILIPWKGARPTAGKSIRVSISEVAGYPTYTAIR